MRRFTCDMTYKTAESYRVNVSTTRRTQSTNRLKLCSKSYVVGMKLTLQVARNKSYRVNKPLNTIKKITNKKQNKKTRHFWSRTSACCDCDFLLNWNFHLYWLEFFISVLAGNISKNNISSVIFDSKPNESHDAFSYMLNMPLLSTEPFRASPENSSLGDYEISVGPSTISAMVDLIVKYKWINVVVLYDGMNNK